MGSAKQEWMLFAANSNIALSQAVAAWLDVPLGQANVSKFSDGEIRVEIQENVRARDIYVMQSVCEPTNDNLMESLILIDALRRASAATITAVFPYLGYSRQDRRTRSARVPITARLVANMIASAGADRVLTVDVHAEQIQGFYDMSMDNIFASPILLEDIRQREFPNLMVISPDVGGVVRARAVARRLGNADLAIIDKRRPAPNVSEVMNIIGDVKDKDCIVVDDLVDTAGTLCAAAAGLKNAGAATVHSYATHAVFSGSAIENINNSQIDELVVTNTIPLKSAAIECDKIRQLCVSGLIGESIRRIISGDSLSSLFSETTQVQVT